jgi:hypothetical protein
MSSIFLNGLDPQLYNRLKHGPNQAGIYYHHYNDTHEFVASKTVQNVEEYCLNMGLDHDIDFENNKIMFHHVITRLIKYDLQIFLKI